MMHFVFVSYLKKYLEAPGIVSLKFLSDYQRLNTNLRLPYSFVEPNY